MLYSNIVSKAKDISFNIILNQVQMSCRRNVFHKFLWEFNSTLSRRNIDEKQVSIYIYLRSLSSFMEESFCHGRKIKAGMLYFCILFYRFPKQNGMFLISFDPRHVKSWNNLSLVEFLYYPIHKRLWGSLMKNKQFKIAMNFYEREEEGVNERGKSIGSLTRRILP